MKAKIWKVLILIVLIAGQLMNIKPVKALGTPQFVSVNPPSPASVGTNVSIRATVVWDNDFRSMRICFRDENWCQEDATPDITKNFDTSGLSAGTYQIIAEVAAKNQGWDTANKTYTNFELTANQPAPTNPPSVSCSVDSFSVWPNPTQVGTTIRIMGSGSCNTGVRATKLRVDDRDLYEIGSPSLDTIWNTNGVSEGTHVLQLWVAGWGDNDWSRAAKSSPISVQLNSNQPAPTRPVDIQPTPVPTQPADAQSTNGGNNTNAGDSGSSTNTNDSCPSAPARLKPGDIAIVSDYTPYSVNIRTQPSINAAKIGKIPVYGSVTVIAGPKCSDGYRWFEIGYQGIDGWSAEVGQGGEYNFIPNGQPMPTADSRPQIPVPTDTPKPVPTTTVNATATEGQRSQTQNNRICVSGSRFGLINDGKTYHHYVEFDVNMGVNLPWVVSGPLWPPLWGAPDDQHIRAGFRWPFDWPVLFFKPDMWSLCSE